MPTPEETEQTLNDAFKRAGLKTLAVYWDGNIVTTADPATFDVYFKDEPTRLIVRNFGDAFVAMRRGPRFKLALGQSDVPSGVVDIIRAEVYDHKEEAA